MDSLDLTTAAVCGCDLIKGNNRSNLDFRLRILFCATSAASRLTIPNTRDIIENGISRPLTRDQNFWDAYRGFFSATFKWCMMSICHCKLSTRQYVRWNGKGLFFFNFFFTKPIRVNSIKTIERAQAHTWKMWPQFVTLLRPCNSRILERSI